MATSYTTRTSPTTTWTGRTVPSSFTSYTWSTSPDIWSVVSATWDTYGSMTGTSWTGRVTP